MKKIFSFFNFATQFVWRLTFVITAILIIWHLTLVKSPIPYINHWGTWVSTIIAPFFTLVGCNAIFMFYMKKGHIFGDVASVGGDMSLGLGDVGDGEGCLVIIGLFLFIMLLPVIAWFLPAEVLFGALHYKKTIWEEIIHAWNNLTPKEGIFVITKGVFIAGAISFIVWEAIAHTVQQLYKIGVFVAKGKNDVK